MSKEHEQSMSMELKMDALRETTQALKKALEEERTYLVLVETSDEGYQCIQLGRDSEAASMSLDFIFRKMEDDPMIMMAMLEAMSQ